MLKRISSYFKPYVSSLVSALICSLLVGGVTAATAKLVEPILDDVFIKHDEMMLKVIPIVVVLLFLIKGVARYAQQVILVRVGETVVIKIRNDLMSAIQYREMRFFEENATGALLARMLTDVAAMQGAIPSVVDFIRHVFAAIGLVTVLFMQDWKLAIIALFVMPLAIYPVKRVSHLIKNYTKRVQTRLGLLSKILVEAFSGIEVVKSFGTEEREIGRFLDESDNVLRQILKRARVNAATSPFLELLGAVGAALIIGYGGHQVLKGTMTPGNFFSFLTALLLLSEPVKKLGSVNNRIQQAIGAAERVFGIMDEERAPMETVGKIPLEGDVTEVSFEDVHFSYAKGEEVLKGISFTAKKGEMVAFVGDSGAGKSTILRLLPRFYMPQAGFIRINGRDIKEYEVASLRRSIAMVNQNTFLFDDTIYNNILLGRPGATAAEVRAAAEAANAICFIEEADEGMDTFVGERGDMLSGGQKQRISIARAILRDAPILILDEATSALDSESEQAIQNALAGLMEGRTTFVIAHRLSTVRHADKIIFLKDGVVIEEGRHEELIAKNGEYARVCSIQFGEG